jgi:catechol 2,3-dioxygenase-like lactoylglutathione lyase family enzyme
MDKVSVRYIVTDVDEAIAFYTRHLGFAVEMHPAPGFAMIARENLRLLLSRPGEGGGGHAAQGGALPAPGGWNRIHLPLADLEGTVSALKGQGCRFRGEIVNGVAGKQIILEDPSGNPIELFEPFPAGGGQWGGKP